MTRYIFITGGVLSGVGKGVTAASIGALLTARGYRVFVQKFDPYLNRDPGTMSPYQHGEVFVTKDGQETDLDLGHYERFIGRAFSRESNYTAGFIYEEIFKKEREGGYLGLTVQVIPHVTDIITSKIINAAKHNKPDFMIIEIGGTVGDIESQPFIHAIASFGYKTQKPTFYLHTTYVPYLPISNEYKTKPTQHSIQSLRSYGIHPNGIILRSNQLLTTKNTNKVAKYSALRPQAVISLPDLNNIYQIPLFLEQTHIISLIEKKFRLKPHLPNLKPWEKIDQLIKSPKKVIKIAMVGKYVELHDAYLSIIESLKIASLYQTTEIEFKWISSVTIQEDNVDQLLKNQDGIIILHGFGKRGFHGKVLTAHFARVNKVPVIGICYGMQAMVVEQAQHQGYLNATSGEFKKRGTLVIDLIRGKSQNDNLGGSLRLGEWETKIKPGTLAHQIYNQDMISERHRHRYEVNPKYLQQLEDDQFIFSGISIKTKLAEILELKNHPFYLGVQYHPEFATTAVTSNPLFDAFIKAINQNRKL